MDETSSSLPPSPEEPISARLTSSQQAGRESSDYSELHDVDLLRSIVDLTTDAIFVKDRQGKYLLFNRAASDFVGRPVDEVLGHDDSELFTPDSAQLVRRRDELVMESGKPMVGEERLVASGTERTYLASKVPLKSSDGQVVGLIGISRDISDRKRSEEKVFEHQAFLEAIIQTAAEGICVFEQLSPLPVKFSVWNDRMVELTGYSLDEMNELGWSRALDVSAEGDPGERGEIPFLNLYSLDAQREVEGRIRRKDGAVRILTASTSRVKLGAGSSTYVALIQDITDRRRMEQAHKESEQRFRLFTDHLPGRAWIKDDQCRYVFINKRMQEEFGRQLEDCIGLTAVELYGTESTASFQKNDERVLAENHPFSMVESIRRPDGTMEWSHVSKFPIPAVGDQSVMLGGVAFDITHVRRIETALRESEQRFRWFMQNIPGPAWIKDQNLRYTFVNAAFQREVKKSEEEFLGHTDFEIFDEKIAAMYQENDRRALGEGRAIEAIETTLQADGAVHHFHVSKFPIFGEDGQSSFVGGFAVDISEKLRASEERQISEERLRVAQSLAHIGSFFWSIERNELFWSDELYRIYGYEPRAIEPNLDVFLSHIHIDDKERVKRALAETIANGGRFQHEYRIRTLYNEVRWVMATGRCACDAAGLVIALEGTCQDISERKNLEEQLQHSQKMEAIGLLAGGVAHDFNNLLTVITGYTYMLMGQPGLSHPIHESLVAIQDAAHRAATLTRQLLTFSRRQRLEPVILDINKVILGTEKLLKRFVGNHVRLSLDLADDLGLVRIDAAQVEQVLINLAINARDAMPNGGELKITTRNSSEPATSAAENMGGSQRRHFAELFVSDNGVGMTEEVRQRIFEPFFTTKDIGKGTGLGLSVVHGIVEQSEGEIQVQSEVGRGTVFRIRLPIVSDLPDNVDHDEDATDEILRKTVLLVDDDDAVRRVARVTLESHGFLVLEAQSADEALKIVEQNEQPIDMLVTDVSMPRIRGRELAVNVIQRIPGIRVLFISGYANNSRLQEGLSVPNDFLEKPFTPHELIARVANLISFVADQRS